MSSQRPILIWDWDGTLVDTITYKYDGIWDDVFSGDFEKQKIVKDFLKSPEGKGVNRYGLIKKALGLDGLSDDELKNNSDVLHYAKLYKKFSEESALKNGVYLGTKEVLEKFFSDGCSMYIISGGGSDDDLKGMAEALGIARFFKGIFGFGSPGSALTSFDKGANFKRIIEQEGQTDPSQYTVLGDSISDHEFAESVGARFIGFRRPWNDWEGYEDKVRLVYDISEIREKLS